MNPQIDFNCVKDRVLVELGKSIKLIQCYAVCGFDGVAILGNDSWLVQSLSHSLDLALRHGLRDPHRGYWMLVREFTHSNTLQTIISLKTVHSPLGKGRAWLYFTLGEGSLSSYLQCLSRDQRALCTYYAPPSLMRDTARLEQLITLLAGLDHVQFNLDVDVSYLDMSTYPRQDTAPPSLPSLPKCSPTMTSSLASSLASPVDSGVALLDSDADATSVSEATLNGGDSISLREDDSGVSDLDTLNQVGYKLLPTSDTTSVPRKVHRSDTMDGGQFYDANELLFTAEKHSTHKPVLVEAVLMQDESSATSKKENILNAKVMEKAILHDAASHFKRKAMFHNSLASKTSSSDDVSEDDVPKITVTKAQFPEEIVYNTTSLDEYNSCLPFCETEAALEVYEVYPVMTASDIANQNIEPVATVHSGQVPNVRLGRNVVNLKHNKANAKPQLQDDTSMNGSSTDCDEIVFRRQRKKRNKNEVKVKRVSFHEDLIVGAFEENTSLKKTTDGGCDSNKRKDGSSDFSASFLPPNPIIKKDVVRGRYSWCGQGDVPYISQRSNTRSEIFATSSADQTDKPPHFDKGLACSGTPFNYQAGGDSDPSYKYQSSAVECVETHPKSFHDRLSCQPDQSLFEDVNDTMLQMDDLIQSTPHSDCTKNLPVTERGNPEGQEDPQRTCSTQHLSLSAAQNYSFPHNLKKVPSLASSIDCFSDLESLRSDPDDRCKLTKNNVLYGSYNKSSQSDRLVSRRHFSVRECKTSLLNRFLKSVTVKKFVEKKARIVRPTRSMYIKGVKFDPDINNDFNETLESEIRLGRMELPPNCHSDVPVDSNLEMIFKSQIFVNEKERVDKVFRVRGCYFVGEVTTALLVLLTDANIYITGVKMNHAYCNHLVLPYADLDSILVGPNSQSLMLVSANGDTRFTVATGDGETTHELVSRIEMRVRSNGLNPPAVKILELEDMKALRHSISVPADMADEDLLHYYSLIHLQDDQHSLSCSPLGPTREGHLMFRPATHAPLQPWTPAYCVLKAGVLYMFSDPDHRLPKRVLMLRNGHCKGCLRFKDRRPHTFAILLKGSGARSLQFAAADEYEASDWLQAFIQAAAGVHEGEGVETTPCSLIVTSRHVVTCREQFPSGQAQALAVANIADITAFRAEHSWCVLEFACREVHESSGDWVLYFTSVNEMEKFRKSLEELWPHLTQSEFPVSAVLDETLRRRCLETSNVLAQAWEHLVPFKL